MHENHLSLNKDFDLYCAVFQCKTCTNYNMARAIIHDIVRRTLSSVARGGYSPPHWPADQNAE